MTPPTERRRILDVLTAAAAAAAATEDVPSGVPGPVDAELTSGLLAAAARTRMLPLLDWYLRDRGIRLHEWFGETSEAARSQADRRTARLVAAAARAGVALEAAGLPHAFRKGVHLCHVYPEPSTRPFSDVDLLVSREDEEAVERALTSAGFTRAPSTRAQRAYLAVATNSARGFYATDGGARSYVDPASNLLIPALITRGETGLDLDSVACASLTIGTGALRVLTTPYALLDAVVNLYLGATALRYVNRMRFQRLIPYVDVLALSNRMSNEDWAIFRSAVDRLGLDRAAAFAFGNGSRLFGAGTFDRHWPVDSSDPVLDAYAALDLGTPLRWDVPVDERVFLDVLPEHVPPWSGPM